MLPWLQQGSAPCFPDTRKSLEEPNGLLAAGGELSPEWLKAAYSSGIFPWFSEGDPILWWSPSPRCVLFPEQFHLSRSMRKTVRKLNYEIHIDRNFEAVMRRCAAPRANEQGTWISEQMISAYCALNQQGIAHSVEVYVDDRLVGGLYGLSIGRVFFGESMFSDQRDASKIAAFHLCAELEKADYAVVDCQIYNPHLESIGAVEIGRDAFDTLLEQCRNAPNSDPWAHKIWNTIDDAEHTKIICNT